MSEWISVKDKRPSMMERVLIFIPTKKRITIARAWENTFVMDGLSFIGFNSVAYWMPLPEPPRMEG